MRAAQRAKRTVLAHEDATVAGRKMQQLSAALQVLSERESVSDQVRERHTPGQRERGRERDEGIGIERERER